MRTNVLIQWLLQGTPWVEYRTRLDLLEQSETESDVIKARQAMLDHPQVSSLISELAGWPGHVLKRHNDANHMIHQLVFLADIGVTAVDPGMDTVIRAITSHRSEEGLFQIVMNITSAFGGDNEDHWTWMLCDAPSILYALLKMKADIPGLKDSVDFLAGLVHENGWRCTVAPELGKFKGPGRKEDPCPYASLVTLKALAQIPELDDSQAFRYGAESLLNLWELRREKKPYLFGMGTDFKKLKTPYIWYDILHVLDVLTQFPRLMGDNRFEEMLGVLRDKIDSQPHLTAESVWKAWKEWDFGQKKEPSQWITFLACRILKRTGSPVAEW
ncbi:MAG: hypothetical protein JW712_03610 [Dehalococcoidales bacterium]|nr:hypothetical protein [Dehalococcoidales bacterium]